jgi:hypothetical protein
VAVDKLRIEVRTVELIIRKDVFNRVRKETLLAN